MQYKWLKKENSASITLFFSGWGQTPAYFQDFQLDDADVLMLYDYQSLDFSEINSLCNAYNNVNCISWSFGVLVGAHFLLQNDINGERIAINGTLSPVDYTFGIPPAIFKGTLDGLSETNWKKFIFRIFPDRTMASQFLEMPHRSIDQLKKELKFLGEVNSIEDHTLYQQAFISNSDRIFPYQNQINAWESSEHTVIDGAHFPFDKITFLSKFKTNSNAYDSVR
ncbi:DUF452 family protein [Flammeovirga sp. MY04]|uniref:DUF452 family protein n=1 Tax=Flammeovirga sp. MY04 TaxID=1191459 RepID=UPI0008062C18|nr:pimeloyl-ACP methyl esterase BioG family protein [Flammeovirga sp. MY04]ANQ47914.1 DUF452 family protein [Flammeovirga sp. MY04]